MAESNGRKKMGETLNKYIPALDYVDNILLPLLCTSSGVSFTAMTDKPAEIASASISLLF